MWTCESCGTQGIAEELVRCPGYGCSVERVDTSVDAVALAGGDSPETPAVSTEERSANEKPAKTTPRAKATGVGRDG